MVKVVPFEDNSLECTSSVRVYFLSILKCFVRVKSQFREKIRYSLFRNFSFTTQECDNITTPTYSIFALLSVGGRLREVTKKISNF